MAVLYRRSPAIPSSSKQSRFSAYRHVSEAYIQTAYRTQIRQKRESGPQMKAAFLFFIWPKEPLPCRFALFVSTRNRHGKGISFGPVFQFWYVIWKIAVQTGIDYDKALIIIFGNIFGREKAYNPDQKERAGVHQYTFWFLPFSFGSHEYMLRSYIVGRPFIDLFPHPWAVLNIHYFALRTWNSK